MNRIETCLTELRQLGRKALIPFLVAGDPDLAATRELALTLIKNGADLIELGVPFSDPSADGPYIMAADARALAGGTRLDNVLELVADLRQKTDTPILLLLYYNLIYRQGPDHFFAKCQSAGVDGVIVPDLPCEEMLDVRPTADAAGVLMISMVTPLSGKRLPMLTQNARGFLYCVAALGVTGERSDFGTDLHAYSRQLAAVTGLPRALGFGISTPEQVRSLADDWDALIVGSAIVRRIAEGFAAGLTLTEVSHRLAAYCHDLRDALDYPAGSPLVSRCSPDFSDYRQLSERSRLIPVARRLTADTMTPISLFQRFDDQSSAWLLESVINGERWARYSIMGRKPLFRLTCRQGKISLKGPVLRTGTDFTDGDPITAIRELLAAYRLPPELEAEGFRCGLVGYFAYDFIRYLEKLPDKNPDELDLPDCDLMAPAEVVVYDHLKAELTLVVNTLCQGDPQAEYRQAVSQLDQLESTLSGSRMSAAENALPAKLTFDFQPNVSRDLYLDQVSQARRYIKAGDIFQVVLSQRFTASYSQDPFAVYRALRHVNPSPYLFYLRTPEAVLIGASPEMLVRMNGQTVETCPIAGTRPRGQTGDADNTLAADLLADEKELAEHAMLVDLARNDIGRISRFGSVRVKDFCHVERFSHVMHLVTTVEGQIREDRSAVDVLASLLPAGTLSGAPKIRAMEIIDELETVRRGPYGGAVGYLGFDGRLDTCITIRTAVLKDGQIHIQAGAGIVADSVPETEYDETLNKARAVLTAISKAGDFI
ncbi:MAG TPA: hypothetical protein DCM45_00695 [Clostridiales bacterium]|nr:hypothetical protein [Clostridiales bacterium]